MLPGAGSAIRGAVKSGSELIVKAEARRSSPEVGGVRAL